METTIPGRTPRETRENARDNGATAGVLQQIENAVAVMKATPAIRFSKWHHVQFQHNADSMAEVDAIAAGIGAEAGWNKAHTQYEATREYGPNVSYCVVFITREYMKAYEAHWAAFREEQDTHEDEPEREMAEAAA